MMNAIEVYNVSKKYILHREKPTLLKDLFLRPFKRHETIEEFWALKNINFEIKKGETVGIIGENGAGKSTILKILTGVTRPTSGTVKVDGRVGSLLELGAGFHPDLTGRENIYLNGSILGFSKKEIGKKFDEIVDFSGIEEFIDTPVRTYSSGMFVRLGFSVAVHMEPEILIIDEVLAVGDEGFQRKCYEKMDFLKEKNTTILLVTHDVNKVRQLCRKGILLSDGNLWNIGSPGEVVDTYRSLLESKSIKEVEKLSSLPRSGEKRYGSREAEIIKAMLLDKEGKETYAIRSDEDTTFRVEIDVHQDVENPIAGFILSADDGTYLYNTNTLWRNQKLGNFKKGNQLIIEYKQKMKLLPGMYCFTPAISYPDGLHFYDWRTNIFRFRIIGDHISEGFVDLNSSIIVTSKVP